MSPAARVLRVLGHPLSVLAILAVAGYALAMRALWSSSVPAGAFGAWDVAAATAADGYLVTFALLPLWLAATVASASRARSAAVLLRVGSPRAAWRREVGGGARVLAVLLAPVALATALGGVGLPAAATGLPATPSGSFRALGVTQLAAVALQTIALVTVLLLVRALVAGVVLLGGVAPGAALAVVVAVWFVVSGAGGIPRGAASATAIRDTREALTDPTAAGVQLLAGLTLVAVVAVALGRARPTGGRVA